MWIEESYNKDLREKSIKEKSKSDSESIAAVIETYILKQEQFFKSENKLGRFKEIGFADTTASMYFQIQDLGAGIGVTYKSMFGCSRNSTWLYTTSIQDGKLTWYTSAPQDENCKLENLARLARLADFPFVCSNYVFTGTPCEGLVRPYAVIERNGLRVGVVGVSPRLEGLVSKQSYGATRYLSPAKAWACCNCNSCNIFHFHVSFI